METMRTKSQNAPAEMKTVETFEYPLGNMILTIRITERCKSGTIHRTPEIIKVRMSDMS